jgi:hypothetical protein
VIAIKIADRPGELGKLLQTLDQNSLNIEYVYGLTESNKDHAVLIFSFDDLDRAVEVLQASHITLISTRELMEA